MSKNQKISSLPPKGFRDYLNDSACLRLAIVQKLAEVFQAHGFLPIQTPAVENLEVLLGSGGGENEKLSFKILKRGEKLTKSLENHLAQPSHFSEVDLADLGLRFDLTVPLSRVVSNYQNELVMPWKVFQMGTVWRAERPQKGRFREFTQADVDIIGSDDLSAEVEVIQAGVRAVQAVCDERFELRINDRRLIFQILQASGVSENQQQDFLIVLDKKDKVPLPDLVQEAEALLGKSLNTALQSLFAGTFSLKDGAALHAEAAQDLATIIELLQSLDLPLERIVFDPSLARGLGYYTGCIFELRHASAGFSFGGGGRYDKLIGRLSHQTHAAVGFSIGFDRLMLLLEENPQNFIRQLKNRTFFLPVLAAQDRTTILSLANILRGNGFQVDVYPGLDKMAKQLKFASKKGHRWVVILGEAEQQARTAQLKNFDSGAELAIPYENLEGLGQSLAAELQRSR